MDSPDELQRLRFDDSDGFDIALRRRGQVFELVVNGMFAMDSTDASSEIALADLVPDEARRVLVGGLGLGFTAGALLDRLDEVQVDVAELSSGLIHWAGEGVVPSLTRVAEDPRASLVHTDVADLLRSGNPTRDERGGSEGGRPPIDSRRAPERGTSDGSPRDERGGSEGGRPPSPIKYDAILLDVDNGPDFLIHDHNAALYGDDLLAAAHRALAPGGLLAIWCEGETPALDEALRRLSPDVSLVTVPVERDGHHIDYAIHCARRS